MLDDCSLCANKEDPRFGDVVDGRSFPLCDGCGGPENVAQMTELVAKLRAVAASMARVTDGAAPDAGKAGALGHSPALAGEGCPGCDAEHERMMDKHVGPSWRDKAPGVYVDPFDGAGARDGDRAEARALLKGRREAMNVNDATVPCPTCGGAVQGSTLKAAIPLREEIDRLRTVLLIIGVHATKNDNTTIAHMARAALWPETP